jgi:hypothetical protein
MSTDGADKGSGPRWIEAVRRARVVRTYLKIERPTVADAEGAASDIGISKRSFYYLARAFGASQSERIIKDHSSRIAPEAEAIIASAIGELGADSPVDRVGRLARERAKNAGVTMPANKTIATRLRTLTEQALTDKSIVESVVVDHAALEIPIIQDDRRYIPYVSVVLDVNQRRILGFNLHTSKPSAASAANALLNAVQNNGSLFFRPGKITYQSLDAEPWQLLRDALTPIELTLDPELKPAITYGAYTGRILANRIGGIPLRPRLATSTLLARTASSSVTSMADLGAYLAEQLSLTICPSVPDGDSIEVLAKQILRLRSSVTS